MAVLLQASLQNQSIHKKFTRPAANSPDLKIFVEVCSFTWNDFVIYFITPLPQNLCIICKFVKIDHDEACKMSYQQSSGAENDTTRGVF